MKKKNEKKCKIENFSIKREKEKEKEMKRES